MKINYEKLYASVGYLFYSVAACDGHVHPSEIAQLQELIKSKWLDYEDTRDDFGTDAAHYIQFAFDVAQTDGLDYKVAWERFEDHFKENKTDYSKDLNELIMKTSEAIANVFHKKNKSELTILTQLGFLLKEADSVES